MSEQEGRNALVWGATGGIGSALVQVLQEEGWQVAAVTHRPGSGVPGAALTVDADVTSAGAVQAAVYEVAQALGDVALHIYAVGDIAGERLGAAQPGAWDRIVGANLTGAANVTQAALPLLAPAAHLIYIGARPELVRRGGLAAYAAAKAGLEAFAAVLALEQPSHRVTVVRPGAVATGLWAKVGARAPRTAQSPAALARAILDAHAAGAQGILDL